jgi:hypothetical protein
MVVIVNHGCVSGLHNNSKRVRPWLWICQTCFWKCETIACFLVLHMYICVLIYLVTRGQALEPFYVGCTSVVLDVAGYARRC